MIETVPTTTEIYVVESILYKCKINGKINYLIKWKGYPDYSNTWEPMYHLYSIKDIVKAWERSIGYQIIVEYRLTYNGLEEINSRDNYENKNRRRYSRSRSRDRGRGKVKGKDHSDRSDGSDSDSSFNSRRQESQKHDKVRSASQLKKEQTIKTVEQQQYKKEIVDQYEKKYDRPGSKDSKDKSDKYYINSDSSLEYAEFRRKKTLTTQNYIRMRYKARAANSSSKESSSNRPNAYKPTTYRGQLKKLFDEYNSRNKDSKTVKLENKIIRENNDKKEDLVGPIVKFPRKYPKDQLRKPYIVQTKKRMKAAAQYAHRQSKALYKSISDKSYSSSCHFYFEGKQLKLIEADRNRKHKYKYADNDEIYKNSYEERASKRKESQSSKSKEQQRMRSKDGRFIESKQYNSNIKEKSDSNKKYDRDRRNREVVGGNKSDEKRYSKGKEEDNSRNYEERDSISKDKRDSSSKYRRDRRSKEERYSKSKSKLERNSQHKEEKDTKNQYYIKKSLIKQGIPQLTSQQTVHSSYSQYLLIGRKLLSSNQLSQGTLPSILYVENTIYIKRNKLYKVQVQQQNGQTDSRYIKHADLNDFYPDKLAYYYSRRQIVSDPSSEST